MNIKNFIVITALMLSFAGMQGMGSKKNIDEPYVYGVKKELDLMPEEDKNFFLLTYRDILKGIYGKKENEGDDWGARTQAECKNLCAEYKKKLAEFNYEYGRAYKYKKGYADVVALYKQVYLAPDPIKVDPLIFFSHIKEYKKRYDQFSSYPFNDDGYNESARCEFNKLLKDKDYFNTYDTNIDPIVKGMITYIMDQGKKLCKNEYRLFVTSEHSINLLDQKIDDFELKTTDPKEFLTKLRANTRELFLESLKDALLNKLSIQNNLKQKHLLFDCEQEITTKIVKLCDQKGSSSFDSIYKTYSTFDTLFFELVEGPLQKALSKIKKEKKIKELQRKKDWQGKKKEGNSARLNPNYQPIGNQGGSQLYDSELQINEKEECLINRSSAAAQKYFQYYSEDVQQCIPRAMLNPIVNFWILKINNRGDINNIEGIEEKLEKFKQFVIADEGRVNLKPVYLYCCAILFSERDPAKIDCIKEFVKDCALGLSEDECKSFFSKILPTNQNLGPHVREFDEDTLFGKIKEICNSKKLNEQPHEPKKDELQNIQETFFGDNCLTLQAKGEFSEIEKNQDLEEQNEQPHEDKIESARGNQQSNPENQGNENKIPQKSAVKKRRIDVWGKIDNDPEIKNKNNFLQKHWKEHTEFLDNNTTLNSRNNANKTIRQSYEEKNISKKQDDKIKKITQDPLPQQKNKIRAFLCNRYTYGIGGLALMLGVGYWCYRHYYQLLYA